MEQRVKSVARLTNWPRASRRRQEIDTRQRADSDFAGVSEGWTKYHDAVVVRLRAAHHALAPPVLDHAFQRLHQVTSTMPLGSVKHYIRRGLISIKIILKRLPIFAPLSVSWPRDPP
jgi:hypothetical protein